jgi:parallel beta-helix repeat protein
VGILLALTVSDTVTNNVVTAAAVGLDFGALVGGGTSEGFNTFACVEGNHLDGNEIGVAIIDNNTGNTFKKNYANGNVDFGFGSDASSGADAVPNAGPNVFRDNHASGNGTDDYLDLTVGYTGTNPNTNSGTADYYKGNKGNIASPPAILFQ